MDGYDVAANGQQVSPEALAAFIEQQTAAYIQAGLQQQQQVPVPQGPSAEDVALAEARAREAEAQLAAARLAKLGAQSMGGSGGRPEPAADDDAAFAKSLLDIHQTGYAGQMAKRGN